MSDNSKQNEESFFSLMIQFSIIMLVFWIIISILRPLLPKDTSDEEIANNGKRNFQYACSYNAIEEESENENNEFTEVEQIDLSEISRVSYDVIQYVNNIYSDMIKKMKNEFSLSTESSYVSVKAYNFFYENQVAIGEDENGEYFLIISDEIKSLEDINEKYRYEILVGLAEVYSKQYLCDTNNTLATYEEGSEFGNGLKRLVFEEMVDSYLEKEKDIVLYFLKNCIPDLEKNIFDDSYIRVSDDFNKVVEENANVRGFYTPMEALEYHLKQYYENGKSEQDLLCCLELALIPKSTMDTAEKEKSYELLKEYISPEYWHYFRELIYE